MLSLNLKVKGPSIIKKTFRWEKLDSQFIHNIQNKKSINNKPDIKKSETKIKTSKTKTTKENKENKEKKENKNEEIKIEENENWKVISGGEDYTVQLADVGSMIRVRGILELQNEFIEKIEIDYESKPIKIEKKNQIIEKMASSMLRSRKAEFQCQLSMGENVIIQVDADQFIIKSGQKVLLRSNVKQINIEINPLSIDSVILRAKHNYNTELTFGPLAMKGGNKFTPNQTRDLFYETISQFQS